MYKVTVFCWLTAEWKWSKFFHNEQDAEKYADYWFANEDQMLSSTYDKV